MSIIEVIHHIKAQEVWWLIQFTAVYLGNPVLFFLFIFLVAPLSEGKDSWLIAKTVGTNVTWLNPLTYILITLPVYLIWLSLPRALLWIDLQAFLDCYVTPVAMVAAVPGLINLYVWCTTGMEGNIMGFIFMLPMLIAAVAYAVMWILALRSALASSGGQETMQRVQAAPVV